MRDAMGGTVALVIIVIFIVFALGYMAFNVNYTKAFRMKNKIIATYEDYDGVCLGDCNRVIKEYANTIGYSNDNSLVCDNGYQKDDYNLYCYKEVFENESNDTDGIVDEDVKKHYYKIITRIRVEVPIINNILNLSAFQITGDTKSFVIKPKE